MTNGAEMYQLAEELGMINQLKELRENVAEIRGQKIRGGFNGILMALGAEMDRRRMNRDNRWNNKVTGPVTYEQAQRIDNLIGNIENIRSQVNKAYYFGMLKALGLEMTQRHGAFGER